MVVLNLNLMINYYLSTKIDPSVDGVIHLFLRIFDSTYLYLLNLPILLYFF